MAPRKQPLNARAEEVLRLQLDAWKSSAEGVPLRIPRAHMVKLLENDRQFLNLRVKEGKSKAETTNSKGWYDGIIDNAKALAGIYKRRKCGRPGEVAVGSLPARFQNHTAIGSALHAAQQNKGLGCKFADPMAFMDLLHAVHADGPDIPGKFGFHGDQGRAHATAISIQHTGSLLQKLATHVKQTVEEITGFSTLQELHDATYEQLSVKAEERASAVAEAANDAWATAEKGDRRRRSPESLAMAVVAALGEGAWKHAAEKLDDDDSGNCGDANGEDDGEDDGDGDEDAVEQTLNEQNKQHISILTFLTLATIKVHIEDIVHALTHRICGVDVRIDGELEFPTKIAEKFCAEFCVGSGTVQEGLDPNEYDGHWYTNGDCVVDLFGTAAYDLDAKVDPSHTAADFDTDLYSKLLYPSTGKFVRPITLSQIDDNSLHGFECKIRSASTDNVKRAKEDNTIHRRGNNPTRKYHRLVQLLLAHYGMGLHKNEPLKTFLGGLPLEQAFPYVRQHQELYERKLARKGWTLVRFAEKSDIDHLVGRQELWMHSVLFTMQCSHSWNMSMAHVRMLSLVWCFGMSNKAYTGGN